MLRLRLHQSRLSITLPERQSDAPPNVRSLHNGRDPVRWELEELARTTLEHANLGCPVDPELIAVDNEIEVRDGDTEGLLIGNIIFVAEAQRPQRRAFTIAHELAHWLLRLAGIPDTHDAVNYLAAALLLPRLEFERDLRRLGWDLIALCALHRFASFEVVARRITAMRDARACVFDKPLAGQRRPSSYVIPFDGVPPTAEEREAARAAAHCGAPVELRTGLTAWPVFEHQWQRVITLANV